MRRHLNYANVVATLALVFAMSGGALAAQHYLLSSPKQISPKVLRSLASANTALFKKLSKTVVVTKANTAETASRAITADTAAASANATNATNATDAKNASNAANADKFAGQPASAFAASAQPAFTPATLGNGFEQFGGFAKAGFMKDTLGFVHFRGLMACPGAGGIAFTLPAGDRPTEKLFTPLAVAAGGTGNATIEPSGDVKIVLPGKEEAPCSLDGLSFKAEQ